jgi:tRNA1Val (adenine37-N6)-methyltransferase
MTPAIAGTELDRAITSNGSLSYNTRRCQVSAAIETHFKGCAIPGIVPPGAHISPEVAPDETLDAISGHFRIFQFRDGHRFSTDDVLIAWYGTTWASSPTRVLDLGSGVGSVGMIAAWRLPAARFVTVEAQAESVRLAAKSAAYNGLLDRYEIRHADFREPSAFVTDEQFDLALGSPPYFPPGSGIPSDDSQRVACRFELRGDIRDYALVAAGRLAPGGLFACAFPDVDCGRVEEAATAAGMTIVRRRPVVFREGERPLIALFAMMRGADLPSHMHGRTWVEPPLVIRCADGQVHPEYAAVKLAVGFPP